MTKGFYSASRWVLSDEDIIAIRKEIADYNQKLCPVKYLSNDISQSSPLSSTCEYVPHHFCMAKPDGPPGLVDDRIGSQTVALASECIIARLAAAKPYLKQLSALVGQHDQAKNHRWLYFLAVAVAIGAKVALATTKLCLMDARPEADRRRVLRAVRFRAGQCMRLLKRLTVSSSRWVRGVASRAARRFKRGKRGGARA